MITFQVEPYLQCIEELKPLFPAHWEELALNKDQVPLDPQYEIYEQRAARGEVLMVTIRELGRIVGYFVGFIAPGLHYRTCLTCTMDIFYVAPTHRNGSAGIRLFKFVEQECRRRRVKRMFVGSKCHKDASGLFERLRYRQVEIYYSTWLGDR
jgi:GNAT superfamily N-acetyltransferase